MDLFGIEPNYNSARIKPFIKDERYVKAQGGKRRRKAVHQQNRGFYRVGYPELRENRRTKELYYDIWETNGGRTFEQAVDFLDIKLAAFIAAMHYYKKYGEMPK